MKKLVKMILSFALAAMMLVPAVNTMAAEPLYVYLGEYVAENNVLSLQVGNNLENPTEGITYKVTLGDEELEIVSVTDYADAQMSASYIYLVDVSGSISSKGMENMKATLRALIGNLGAEDNACLMLVGDDAYADDFLSDQNALLEKTEAIDTLPEDTNLYYAINQALDILVTSDKCNERKCLVVLSDGKDDQVTGITETEVKEKIEATNLPICSVVMQGKKSDKEEVGKVMGSFSRMSPGGVHMVFGVNDVDAETAAAGVKHAVENMVLLQADISGYEANGTENYLQVEGTVENIGSAVDGYNVKSVSISQGVVPVETETTEGNTEGTAGGTEGAENVSAETPDETEEAPGLDGKEIAGIILTACIILVVVILLIQNSRKKKKALAAREAEAQKAKEDGQKKDGTSESENPKKEADKVKTVAPVTGETESKPEVPALQVSLTRVGNIEEEVRQVTICGEFVIGRKKELSDLAFTGDQQLSSRHCKLTYDGQTLWLEDLGSLNGTLVNGVPIRKPYELRSDDKFYIGSMEWRIHW